METKKETAQHRLIESSEKTRQLAVELRSGLVALESDLIGNAGDEATSDVRPEQSGLIFRVADDLDTTNVILGQAISVITNLRNEFAAQPTKRAS